MFVSKRALLVACLLATFAVGLAVGAVPAAPYKNGDPLSAAALQGDFEAIEDRLAALEAPQDAYCGLTGGTFSGNLGGYGGAQTHCASVCGGSGVPDPDAHICTTEELTAHAVRGGSFTPHPDGMWYATGTYGLASGSTDGSRDCLGFTSASADHHGSIFYTSTAAYPGDTACNVQHPIACCR